MKNTKCYHFYIKVLILFIHVYSPVEPIYWKIQLFGWRFSQTHQVAPHPQPPYPRHGRQLPGWFLQYHDTELMYLCVFYTTMSLYIIFANEIFKYYPIYHDTFYMTLERLRMFVKSMYHLFVTFLWYRCMHFISFSLQNTFADKVYCIQSLFKVKLLKMSKCLDSSRDRILWWLYSKSKPAIIVPTHLRSDERQHK